MNLHFFTQPVLLRFVAYAFLSNGVWEIAQCSLLYDMRAFAPAKAVFWMISAVLADVILALAVVSLAVALARAKRLPVSRDAWVAALFFGAVVGIAAEWIARAAGLWEYTARMPTMRLANVTVGLVPVLQMAILPAVGLRLAIQESRVRDSSAD